MIELNLGKIIRLIIVSLWSYQKTPAKGFIIMGKNGLKGVEMQKETHIDKLWRWLVRKEFAKTMSPGKIEVCWVDVDNMVHGWVMSADDEINLIRVAKMIQETKQAKLEGILNAKGNGRDDGGVSTKEKS